MSVMRWIAVIANGLVAFISFFTLIFDLMDIDEPWERMVSLCITALFTIITLHLIGIIN